MKNLLEIRNLCVEYKADTGFFDDEKILHAVNNLSLDIKKGEVLAIAGESGCGKSTLARTITRLTQASFGAILYQDKDIFTMNKNDLKNFRCKTQMIFQNPYASLNPKMSIRDILSEPLIINTKLSKCDIQRVVEDIACKVGIDKECLCLYPHEFSGGQRQRIAIARALILRPEFIIADEPVSALDVSIQAQIINLLKDLKNNYNLTFLLITHDISIIKYLADRIAVMYLGEIVEIGTMDEIINNPKHPYTKALLSAAPTLLDKNPERIILEGELPSPTELPDGCKFHTRCPKCMKQCTEKIPPEISLTSTHKVNCFLNF